MSKRLKLLSVGEARGSNSFLKRPNLAELIHVPVSKETTVQQLYGALGAKFVDNPDMMDALYNFLEEEHEGLDESQSEFYLQTKVLELDPEPDIKYFAVFDIIDN
jgi:hypothetical protein